ncbi:ABC transporter permease [Corynebacterium tapiri]|uniref:ABC transporter permease n=1 Tax=Corynebacterium tapiri TaxID=1448266 RepID=A0A5C4U298_9CORY|nr:ABC transporter permease [Corynebacterium tapiri]TNL96614.1 ABC transporter permease [Corynebacterium tapiri]
MKATGWIGAFIVGVIVLLAALSLVWTPHPPSQAFPMDRLHAPSADYLLGTDRFGRDTLSRIMAGSRITLFVGTVAVSISGVLGTLWGVVAGMRRGWVEKVLMAASDLVLAFPALLSAIIAGAAFGPSTLTAMVAIGISGAPAFARVARAATLRVMSQDYILAARLAHVPSWKIALRHVLPNIAGLLIVQASVGFALAVLAEAALSFLGLGTPAPDPSWGRMLQSAQASLATTPWLAIWPGLAIALTVIGFNLLGDGLRDYLDKKGAGRVNRL